MRIISSTVSPAPSSKRMSALAPTCIVAALLSLYEGLLLTSLVRPAPRRPIDSYQTMIGALRWAISGASRLKCNKLLAAVHRSGRTVLAVSPDSALSYKAIMEGVRDIREAIGDQPPLFAPSYRRVKSSAASIEAMRE